MFGTKEKSSVKSPCYDSYFILIFSNFLQYLSFIIFGACVNTTNFNLCKTLLYEKGFRLLKV